MAFSFPFTRRPLALTSLCAALACDPPAGQGPETDADAITTIPNSRVKDQRSTGNCELYTMLAWAESLTADPKASFVRSYAPAYVNYWLWFDHILSRNDENGNMAPSFGSKPYVVRDLIARYGVVLDGSFTYADDSASSLAAQSYLQKAYAPGGSLSTPAARANPRTVRAALDAAFELELRGGLISGMNRLFGADGAGRFDMPVNGTAAPRSLINDSVSIFSPADLVIQGHTLPDGSKTTLADALGAPDPTYPNSRARTGSKRWLEYYLNQSPGQSSAAAAGLSRRVQHALNDNYALPMTWTVYQGNYNASVNQYQGPVPTNATLSLGGHASLFVDYEADNVPGFGRLAAGAPATTEQRLAAMNPQAKLLFFRIKNSWGSGNSPSTVPKNFQAGYYDLRTDFLLAPVLQIIPGTSTPGGTLQGFTSVMLPPGY